ncbi:17365_t:CDS:10 [Entrophospora sp. SA101]|nr:17365_t:CDS:10 [Entrophospora sp. SA101]
MDSFHEKFIIREKNYHINYAALYYARLVELKPIVLESARRKWRETRVDIFHNARFCDKILDIRPDEICYMIGTVYIEMANKPNILDEITKDHTEPPPPPVYKYCGDNDDIMLEDGSGRISLVGDVIKNEILTTGVIMAVLGRQTSDGKFEVMDLCFADLAPQEVVHRMELDEQNYVAFISGMNISEDSLSRLQMQMMVEYLTGELGNLHDQNITSKISRVIVVGNSLKEQKHTRQGNDNSGLNNELFSELDYIFDDICKSTPLDLMPGANDPTNTTFPQQPIQVNLFTKAHQNSNFNCTSGQTIDDIFRYVECDDRLLFAEKTLYWRHIAPTAPDTLFCYPFQDEDPLIINQTPHVYFIGNQKEFKTCLLKGSKNQTTRIILLPTFSTTGLIKSRNHAESEKEDSHRKSNHSKDNTNRKTRVGDSHSHEPKISSSLTEAMSDVITVGEKDQTTHITNGHETANGETESQANSNEIKSSDSKTSATVAALLDQEEKIRQRRERESFTTTAENLALENQEEQEISNKGGWTLDNDDEDDSMEVDTSTGFDHSYYHTLPTSSVDLLPIPKSIDKSEPQTLQFRRNPLLGPSNKKTSSQNVKGKSTKEGVREEIDKSSTSSTKFTLFKDQSDKTMDINNSEDDEDPLDAYMKDVEVEVEHLNEQDKKRARQSIKGSDPEDILALAAKKLKKKDLAIVDHSQVKYEPFRKDFYIEPPEMRDMIPDQVDLVRIDLGIIKKLNFEKPTPIQSQAIPAIMAGRDVIGVAKTGSGKTIAFLLPMFRHIKDQRPLEQMEGPVAIIMTPTRELAVQIHKECKHFLKGLNLRAVCAYGGSPIKDQIAELKRGAEIIVCTPGRMIDLLCANSGRVTNLRRVTYLVLDEADRMFDMGFEPQVMKVVNNVRPDRQTVLFSATFPRQMESLARKVLKRPLEITVGGRSVVAQDVTQIVEVREENTKFVRLLEILGQQYNDDPEARTLIFVDRQEAADNLLRDLIHKGYPCMSLHGGKDQLDRDSTIADFKSGVCQILVATSVAARGLDVKQLKLVTNYECPNHMEDYVHRVGRTGRAGNKGTAYTFITPEQDRYAMDIVKALKLSGGHVSLELQQLADGFQEKVKAGNATYSGSGFGGKGLEKLDEARDLVKKAQRKKEEAEQIATNPVQKVSSPAEAAARVNASVGTSGVQRAKDIIADINARFKDNPVHGNVSEADKTENTAEYSVEIEINDYPQKARWKVTNKEQISQITELTGAAITTRGTYYPPGRQPVPASGERKLYLFVEGENEYVVEKAKNEIKRILTETTLSAIEAESRSVPTKKFHIF